MNSMFKSLVVFALMASINVFASNVSKEDVAEIHDDINKMYNAFESGDLSLLLSKTHPSIFQLVGGKENYEKLTQSAISGLIAQGVVFQSATLGQPAKLYLAGDDKVYFIPRTSVMELQGKKMKSVGFMIAIKNKDSKDWMYLDGSGLRNNQALLWRLLPKLPKNIELPANYVEAL